MVLINCVRSADAIGLYTRKTQSLSAVPPAEHGKKALKKGEPKGGVKNFPQTTGRRNVWSGAKRNGGRFA